MSYLLWDNRVRKKKEGFAMAKKKLDIEVFSAWNTYAVSMMSVLEHCGMWNKEYTFQRFLSVT